ncbi:MAG: molybdopterin molybdotransferase MoeA [Rhodospirillales bacterium]|nr:molybdopterin molybdotransferase MoeA [Rhodospirillales bacterium]
MIPVSEALRLVAANVSLTGTEDVPLMECLGRTVASDLASRLSHPPVAVSSMDGYALKAADTQNPPVILKQIGESQAGGGFDGTLEAGQTVRIFTGAPLPKGADAVQMQENTEADGDAISILESVPAARFVRSAGMDFAEGDILIKTGTVLGARHIGLAAAMNLASLPVRRKPRVAILATGNEVAMPGADLGPSQIISSNSFALHSYVIAMGGEPTMLGIAGDSEGELREAFKGAMDFDVLVTIGGVSVGDYDLVGKVLKEVGLKQIFHKIAMRPGKPLLFGKIGELTVFGMPGNPVSTGVCSMLFLKKALSIMLGMIDTEAPLQKAILGQDLAANDLRQDYIRARLQTDAEGALLAMPFSKQDSAMQARFAEADCLIVRKPHAEPITAGAPVEIMPLRGSLLSL